MKMNKNIEMIQIVAVALEKVDQGFVFVGGATASLYVDDPGGTSVRATDDVDCVIEITTQTKYYELEDRLRANGFQNVPGKVICRWSFNGILIDIMPNDSKILGFTNRWYKEGIKNSIEVKLPNESAINILSLPYFIATKIEAFNNRGKNDFYGSSDIEDVITVIDGNSKTEMEIEAASTDVRKFLSDNFRKFLKDSFFNESISGHLDGPTRSERAKRVIEMISRLTKLK